MISGWGNMPTQQYPEKISFNNGSKNYVYPQWWNKVNFGVRQTCDIEDTILYKRVAEKKASFQCLSQHHRRQRKVSEINILKKFIELGFNLAE